MRRAAVIGVVAIALAASGLLVPAAAVVSQVQITRTSGTPTSGVPLTLLVAVANGVTGQEVRLERKAGTTWKTVSSRKLGSGKQVTLSTGLRLGRNALRVHVLARGNRAATFRSASVTARPLVRPAPYVNEAITISGRLPLSQKRTVTLQRTVGSSWTTVATKKSTGSGSVAFSRPGSVVTVAYRFVAPKSGTRKKFVSPGVVVSPQERTQLVSRNQAGNGPGDAASNQSEISGNGRFVVFRSLASNLGPTDTNGLADIYLRDRAAGTTRLVTRGVGDVPADGPSDEPTISGDGRFVVFTSTASNLVASDANGPIKDVFRFDRATGSVTLISHDSTGGSATADANRPSVSADGSRIAYTSESTDVTGELDDNGVADVFLWSAATDAAIRISKPFDGATDDGGGSNARISGDGKWVAFASSGDSNITAGSPSTPLSNVYLRNVTTATSALVSGTACSAGGFSAPLGVTDGGTQVAYYSSCNDILPADTGDDLDVFVKTMAGGAVTLVSHRFGGGFPDGGSFGGDGSMTPDGSRITFSSRATDLTPAAGDVNEDVFVWVRAGGAITQVSHRMDALGAFSSTGENERPSISDDGRFVVWTSKATNAAKYDTTSGQDIYARDLR